MALRDKNNDELFQLYDSDLILRTNNAKNLNNTRKLPLHYYLVPSAPSQRFCGAT